METQSFKITGIAPLIFHNGLLADPLYEFSRKVKAATNKKPRTDANLEEVARLEFLGSLYLKGGVPVIPGEMIEAALAGRGGAARKQKSGAAASAGLFVPASALLEYDGPKEPDALWKDARFRLRVPVRVGAAKVMRTRPIFDDWAAVVEIHFNPGLVNLASIVEWMQLAGYEVGIGDWRPRFGRFTVETL